MTADGQSAVLRTAGLPIRMWLGAAGPELFALVRRLEAADGQYRRAAAGLAGRLGAELVPSPELSTAERRQVLAVRRGLHRGVPVTGDDCRRLEKLTARCLPAGLLAGFTAELEQAERLAAEVALLMLTAAERIGEEKQRLAAAPWELLKSSPAGRRMLDDRALAPMADIARRTADGEPWTTKRMRQRSDYLWRMIARGAAKTTPRAWLGHVALVTAADAPLTLNPVTLSAEAATEWTENLSVSRATGRGGPDLAAGSLLSLAPLQAPDGEEHLRVWVIDPADPARLRTWRLRRSAALTEITRALRHGPLPLPELEARAFSRLEARAAAATLRAFVARLAEMGVLQVSAPPRQYRGGWHVMDRPGGDHAMAGAGYLDVYRRAAGSPAVSPEGLRHAAGQLQRVRALMQADAAAGRPRRDRIGPGRRPLLAVFAEELSARHDDAGGGPAGRPHVHGTWPEPETPGSGYARLLGAMAAQADAGAAAVRITAGLLDAVDAPGRRVDWPVDCTVRALGGGRWVLDNSTPAGILDARFAEMLERLHGSLPHANAYRDFIAELDRSTGVRSVELLVPPLGERAANAVRRPLYATAWTGDSDPTGYTSAAAGAEYLPLSALTIGRDGHRTVVAADGEPVRPLYHATRTPPYPWSLLSGLLLAGGPQQAWRHCRLRLSLAAYPDRDYFPAVTAGDSVVVTPAQWRVRRSELWDFTAPELTKLRRLNRLRERRGLPRWTFVSGRPGGPPLPCDLESLRALHLLEQAAIAAAGEPGLIVAEMLPGPADLCVTDLAGAAADRVASELMVRLLPPPPDQPARNEASGGRR